MIRSLFVAAALVAAQATTAHATPDVRFLAAHVLPHKLQYAGTTVGGLSGIDRDPRTGEYVMISDDRSNINPVRVYTATVDTEGVEITGVRTLKNPEGVPYPPNAVDPEDVRVDPVTGQYWWSQEGNRGSTTIQPSIERSDRDGTHAGRLPLPANYAITDNAGPRGNRVLEAIAFDRTGTRLTSVVEGPMLQDGEESTVDHGSVARLTVQTRTGEVLAQHVYPLEPLFATPEPGAWGPDTGVPGILADPQRPGRYLTIERSWVPGADYKVRLFEINVNGATDVSTVASLAQAEYKPVHKRLLADLSDFPLPVIDNVEGLAWGPRLRTGERTVVLVSDDNFAAEEFTRFILLAVR
ncbi:esterase-like activity of phytase family protein [Saccharothrix variisporea]|uniref:3-phytase n=1 Tax=Saccharothrix variisporea TaxID=543527 RepID=A0A495XFH5_9PSEU|nr:esterase-like activity of phytase family protein [Saccharothrix variisporea]RKT71564.1 3-phytase [Saccharothrix variisporea]